MAADQETVRLPAVFAVAAALTPVGAVSLGCWGSGAGGGGGGAVGAAAVSVDAGLAVPPDETAITRTVYCWPAIRPVIVVLVLSTRACRPLL